MTNQYENILSFSGIFTSLCKFCPIIIIISIVFYFLLPIHIFVYFITAIFFLTFFYKLWLDYFDRKLFFLYANLTVLFILLIYIEGFLNFPSTDISYCQANIFGSFYNCFIELYNYFFLSDSGIEIVENNDNYTSFEECYYCNTDSEYPQSVEFFDSFSESKEFHSSTSDYEYECKLDYNPNITEEANSFLFQRSDTQNLDITESCSENLDDMLD